MASTAKLEGPIAGIIPAQFRAFFGAETTLTAAGLVKDAGGLRIDRLDLTSARSRYRRRRRRPRTASSSGCRSTPASMTPDARVVLPVPGGQTTVESASLKLSFGESAGRGMDRRRSTSTGLATADVRRRQAVASLWAGCARTCRSQPTAASPSPPTARVTGIVAERADVAEALGDASRSTSRANGTRASRCGSPRPLITGNGLSAVARRRRSPSSASRANRRQGRQHRALLGHWPAATLPVALALKATAASAARRRLRPDARRRSATAWRSARRPPTT